MVRPCASISGDAGMFFIHRIEQVIFEFEEFISGTNKMYKVCPQDIPADVPCRKGFVFNVLCDNMFPGQAFKPLQPFCYRF